LKPDRDPRCDAGSPSRSAGGFDRMALTRTAADAEGVLRNSYPLSAEAVLRNSYPRKWQSLKSEA